MHRTVRTSHGMGVVLYSSHLLVARDDKTPPDHHYL